MWVGSGQAQAQDIFSLNWPNIAPAHCDCPDCPVQTSPSHHVMDTTENFILHHQYIVPGNFTSLFILYPSFILSLLQLSKSADTSLLHLTLQISLYPLSIKEIFSFSKLQSTLSFFTPTLKRTTERDLLHLSSTADFSLLLHLSDTAGLSPSSSFQHCRPLFSCNPLNLQVSLSFISPSQN